LPRILPVLLFLFTLGCFEYVPVDLKTVPLGSRVRAHLSTAGRDSLIARTGAHYETLNGTLVQRRGASVLLSVRSVWGTRHTRESGDLYQRIDVPRQDVLRVELKRLDGLKTSALIAGVTGAVGTVALLSMRGEPGGELPLPSGGPEDGIRFPFLFVRVFLLQ
jgi:hypothetical protein